ncbi:MAG: N-acetylmuramoyl-L-alanine amidase [Prevotella sp.]|uniref:N-acetylmuramoyl-L-alanine amidase family protein n=1 Tax=Prevotella sp. TaxID=59823 RepID=UPI002A27C9D7|nr:N-acetylmuramoyl-L-alanine amidase [Prevotella sp.]MDD7317845.1 N-acetylmuramoyl-L-alanine amidase [Prevotellaceae bacterium]MDY4020760.1 N-acetylmuramoyl-L-alanine amidase [Prevotella sp.]
MRRKLTFVTILLFGIMVAATGAVKKTFTLVIDPGHGGHDSGAVGAMSKEKNINLNVALAFGRLVEANCPDVKVIYTRKTDVFVPLGERANIANRNKADLFISVHTNALPKGRVARGLEVYTLGMHRAADNLEVAKRENSVISLEKDYRQRYEGFDPNSSESYIMFEFIQDRNMSQSVELAKLIQNEACSSSGRNNKGVHQAGFLVLRATSMPSCLVELGFITTPDEESFLNSQDGINRLARGIYNAFAKYKNKRSPTGAVPYIKEEAPPSDDMAQTAAPPVDTRSAAETKPSGEEMSAVEENADRPVFKVQILASPKPLPPGSNMLKGLTGTDSYEEGGYVKYTYGASTDLNEILRLRKELLDKFPQAFVIAFKGGAKMDIGEAMREFKTNNKRKRL